MQDIEENIWIQELRRIHEYKSWGEYMNTRVEENTW